MGSAGTRTAPQERLPGLLPLGDASVFAAFAAQAGASWLRAEEDGWVINMTDDATMKVARFFDQAIDEDLVQTAFGAYSPGWFAAAAKGTIASVVTGSWGDALIQGVSGGKRQMAGGAHAHLG